MVGFSIANVVHIGCFIGIRNAAAPLRAPETAAKTPAKLGERKNSGYSNRYHYFFHTHSNQKRF
jgi:hypothetical protein